MANQGIPPSTPTRSRGFYYGYVVVAAGFFIQAIQWGTYQSFGIFFNPLAVEFGWTRTVISSAASLSWLLVGLASIPVGALSDRLGPRLVMSCCGLFFGAGYLLMSQVSSLWQLYLFYGLVLAVGISGADVITLSTVARWFARKRGTMTGICKMGTGLGLMCMPLVASQLVIAHGWRTSYIILGGIGLAAMLLSAQFLKRDPSQMRQLADGRQRADAGKATAVESGLLLHEAVHTRQFWTVCGVYMIIVFCTQTVMVHIVPHSVDLGISGPTAATLLSTLGGTSIAARFIMGIVGDRVGTLRAMTICFLPLVAALLWLQAARDLWMLYVFAVLQGFSHGGFFAVISPLIAELFGTRSHGTLFGVVFSCGTIGGAVGPILAGRIFDVTDSYQIAFLILAAFSLAGLLLTISLRSSRRETDEDAPGNHTRSR